MATISVIIFSRLKKKKKERRRTGYPNYAWIKEMVQFLGIVIICISIFSLPPLQIIKSLKWLKSNHSRYLACLIPSLNRTKKEIKSLIMEEKKGEKNL